MWWTRSEVGTRRIAAVVKPTHSRMLDACSAAPGTPAAEGRALLATRAGTRRGEVASPVS
jgi:hypothetical protein